MSIAGNISRIRATLPEGVTLIAVSKFHPAEAVREAYEAGVRDFGESRVQELIAKAPLLPADIRWHFIGHLQTNKVRQLIPHVHTIQSVDSLRLLQLIDSEAERIGRRVRVHLQAHVATEETKFGFLPSEMLSQITPEVVASLRAVSITGVMGMASNTDDQARIDADFGRLRSLRDELARTSLAGHREFADLSMGMSHDYPAALRHGATMVRVGTDIFGQRQY